MPLVLVAGLMVGPPPSDASVEEWICEWDAEDLPLSYSFYNYAVPLSPTAMEASAASAFDRWGEALGLTFIALAQGSDSDITLMFLPENHQDLANSAHPLEDDQYSPAHAFGASHCQGLTHEGEIHFNEDVTWRLDGVANPGERVLDFEAILMHELGHSLGIIGHPDEPYDGIMSSEDSGNGRRELSASDIAFFANAYGVTSLGDSPLPPPPPDSDSDGVIDSLDPCPLVAGPVPNDGCLAVPLDFDGDLVSDIVIYNNSTQSWKGEWRDNDLGVIADLGGPAWTPVSEDYDGDGITDHGIYNHTAAEPRGEWRIELSGGGGLIEQLGGPAWVPVPGDFDGDFIADLVIYNPSTGEWRAQYSSDPWETFFFGGPSWTPIAADFDGDGSDDMAIYNYSTNEPRGEWRIHYANGATEIVQYGGPSWTPIPADFDGDGDDDIAIYNHSTNGTRGEWRVLGIGSLGAHGGPAWTPVPADFDGDGKADMAIYNRSTGATAGEWRIQYSSDPWEIIDLGDGAWMAVNPLQHLMTS